MHSEFNHKADETTHFLQIWIEPNVRGIAPGYEQKTFADADKRGKLRLVASPDGADGSVQVHADARLYAGLARRRRERPSLALDPKRKSYVHLVRGELEVNGTKLATGDAAMLEGESQLTLARRQGCRSAGVRPRGLKLHFFFLNPGVIPMSTTTSSTTPLRATARRRARHAGADRPHPDRAAVHPGRLRQDRRLRRHRRLHQLGRPAAAGGRRGDRDPGRAGPRPAAAGRLQDALGRDRAGRVHRRHRRSSSTTTGPCPPTRS